VSLTGTKLAVTGGCDLSGSRRLDSRIVAVTGFHDPGLFSSFVLPTALPPTGR
jgi:hypothetical protein